MKSRECGVETNEIFSSTIACSRRRERSVRKNRRSVSGEASLKCAGNGHCIAHPREPAGVIEGEIAGHDNRAQYRGYFGFYPRSKQTRYLSPRLIHNETAIIRANRETQELGQWDYGLQWFCAPSFILRIFKKSRNESTTRETSETGSTGIEIHTYVCVYVDKVKIKKI